MSKTLSLKLKEEIFKETEKILHQIQKPRNSYINEAVDFYNRVFQRRWLRKKLAHESSLVKQDSLAVLEEFEAFEETIPADY